MTSSADVDALAAAVVGGDRRALARAITLVESSRSADVVAGQALLARVLPKTGGAVRVGLSGAPGAGKSTLIEALGTKLVDAGKSVAVLAVDPSSPVSGGSILGDKTRMTELAKRAGAFIRPSPSGGALGGVARKTREALLLCEAAGFDVVIVETVGVGQSEAAVAGIVDTFVLVLLPGGGDELQGVKRGVLELVDVVVVNKHDGALADEAGRTGDEYRRGLRLLPRALPSWAVPVLLTSAIEGTGVDDLWTLIVEHRAASGPALHEKRAGQAVAWLEAVVDEELRRRFAEHPGVQGLRAQVVEDVRGGKMPATAGALVLLDAFGAD